MKNFGIILGSTAFAIASMAFQNSEPLPASAAGQSNTKSANHSTVAAKPSKSAAKEAYTIVFPQTGARFITPRSSRVVTASWPMGACGVRDSQTKIVSTFTMGRIRSALSTPPTCSAGTPSMDIDTFRLSMLRTGKLSHTPRETRITGTSLTGSSPRQARRPYQSKKIRLEMSTTTAAGSKSRTHEGA